MLLRELLKHTDEKHADHANLQMALEKVKEINTLVNNRKRKDEAIRKVHDIQSSIYFKDQQVS